MGGVGVVVVFRTSSDSGSWGCGCADGDEEEGASWEGERRDWRLYRVMRSGWRGLGFEGAVLGAVVVLVAVGGGGGWKD